MAELENTTETETPSLTKAEAEALWGQLREGLVNVEKVIVKIIETRAWEQLGYTNFLEARKEALGEGGRLTFGETEGDLGTSDGGLRLATCAPLNGALQLSHRQGDQPSARTGGAGHDHHHHHHHRHRQRDLLPDRVARLRQYPRPHR